MSFRKKFPHPSPVATTAALPSKPSPDTALSGALGEKLSKGLRTRTLQPPFRNGKTGTGKAVEKKMTGRNGIRQTYIPGKGHR